MAPRRLSEAERRNECECKQTLKRHAPRVMTSFLMSSPHFSVQIFKFQRRSCKPSFLFPPRRQSAPESFSQARETFDSAVYLLCFFEGSNKVFTNDFFDIFVRVTSLEKLSNQIGKCCYITQALGQAVMTQKEKSNIAVVLSFIGHDDTTSTMLVLKVHLAYTR